MRTLRGFELLVMGMVLAVAGVAGAQTAEKGYVIRFPGFSHVGDRYEMKVETEQIIERNMLQGEAVVHSEESVSTIEFEGIFKVLEVDDRDMEKKVHCTIKRAVLKTDDDKETVLVSEGTEILAAAGPTEKDKDTLERVDGEPLSELAEQLLPKIITFDKGKATMDQAFGSDTPRRVGENWEVNKPTLVAMAKERGMEAAEKDVAGTAKIVSAREVEGEVLLNLEITTDFTFSQLESPVPQADPVSAELSVVHKLTVPEDMSKGPRAQEYEMTMRQVLRGRAGTPIAGITLDGASTERRSATYKTLPAEE
jgi:hypothetical protein